jgi:hypothetical protein
MHQTYNTHLLSCTKREMRESQAKGDEEIKQLEKGIKERKISIIACVNLLQMCSQGQRRRQKTKKKRCQAYIHPFHPYYFIAFHSLHLNKTPQRNGGGYFSPFRQHLHQNRDPLNKR